LTCKANERFALEVPEVRAKLEEVNAVALRADNTDPDPEIAAELKRHGRAGVPLVIVFPRRLERAPIVLPALLTPSLVREALAQAAQ
jgi:thiol:disulfide interchange protein DsbD